MLLKLRVNRLGQIGLDHPSGTQYSPYLVVDSASGSSSAPSSPAPTTFSISSATKVIVSALKSEKDWRIVNLLLHELPVILQNKALIADSKNGADIWQLADALCLMVS